MRFLPAFLTLFFASLVIFALSSFGILNGLRSVFESVTVPLQRTVFGLSVIGNGDHKIEKLKEENRKLASKIVSQTENERDIEALRSQFETADPKPSDLLPAEIIGRRANTLVIDKGQSENVFEGDVVVYEDNLIGVIDKASEYLSSVRVITHGETSFTARTNSEETIGVVKGTGVDLVFDNVVLTEKLEKGDIVITRGDADERGEGLMPGLIVGRVTSVNKKASDLFQSAEVKSFVDFGRIKMVFVLATDN